MRKLLILLAFSQPLWAQGVRYDNFVYSTAPSVQRGAKAPLLVEPGAVITVCSSVSCTGTQPIFSDIGLTQSIQTLTTDSFGRFGFYVLPGTYAYVVTLSGGTTRGPYAFTAVGTGPAFTGGAVSSPIVLPADPTSPSQAATKNYVDKSVAGLTTTQSATGNAVTLNPLNTVNTSAFAAGQHLTSTWTYSMATLFANTGNAGNGLSTFLTDSYGLDGGSNQERAPFYKTNFIGNQLNGTYNTPGQHQLLGETMKGFAAGDVLLGSRFINFRSFYKSSSDEGVHLHDTQVIHSKNSPLGTLSAGSGTGSQNISLSNTQDASELAGGLYVGDMTEAISPTSLITGATKDYTTGTLIVAGVDVSSLPSGVAVQIPAAVGPGTSRAAPGVISVAIKTSGLPTGFASSTSGLSAGMACVWDTVEYGPTNENFEMAAITLPDTSHVSVNFAKTHYGNFAISQGGGCGYGLEMEADRRPMGGNTDVLNVTPLFGGPAVRVDYNAHAFGLVGPGGFSTAACTVSSLSSNGSLATLVVIYKNTNECNDLGGKTVTLAGGTADLMGAHLLTAVGIGALTYTYPVSTGTTESGTSGTVAFNNGAYKLIPIAEAISVLNPTTQAIDGGQITLSPNNIAFANGDLIQQFTGWSQKAMDAEAVQVTEAIPGNDSPSNMSGIRTGVGQGAITSPGQLPVLIQNEMADNLTAGLGTGGTHQAANWGMKINGAFKTDQYMQYMPNGYGLAFHPHGEQDQFVTSFHPMVFFEQGGAAYSVDYTPGTHALNFPGPITCAGAACAGSGSGSGSPGPAPAFTNNTATTSSYGSTPTVNVTGTSPNLSLALTIPQGQAGTNGSNGTAATVSVGTVSTGAAGSTASVTNSGSSSAAVFNFTIPQGSQGATGASGSGSGTTQTAYTSSTTYTAGQIPQANSSGVLQPITPVVNNIAFGTVVVGSPYTYSDTAAPTVCVGSDNPTGTYSSGTVTVNSYGTAGHTSTFVCLR